MRPIHSNVASVLGMSVTSKAVIYHSPATGSVTGSSLACVYEGRQGAQRCDTRVLHGRAGEFQHIRE